MYHAVPVIPAPGIRHDAGHPSLSAKWLTAQARCLSVAKRSQVIGSGMCETWERQNNTCPDLQTRNSRWWEIKVLQGRGRCAEGGRKVCQHTDKNSGTSSRMRKETKTSCQGVEGKMDEAGARGYTKQYDWKGLHSIQLSVHKCLWSSGRIRMFDQHGATTSSALCMCCFSRQKNCSFLLSFKCYTQGHGLTCDVTGLPWDLTPDGPLTLRVMLPVTPTHLHLN